MDVEAKVVGGVGGDRKIGIMIGLMIHGVSWLVGVV